jgi:hypothetical protein
MERYAIIGVPRNFVLSGRESPAVATSKEYAHVAHWWGRAIEIILAMRNPSVEERARPLQGFQ